MSDTAVRARRGSASQWFAVVVSAAAFVLVVIALAGVIVDNDPPKTPTVELGEMYIEGDLVVDAGAQMVVVNVGKIPHNLVVEGGPRTPDLNAQAAAALDLASLADGPRRRYKPVCAAGGRRRDQGDLRGWLRERQRECVHACTCRNAASAHAVG
jgi:hypothetical protein